MVKTKTSKRKRNNKKTMKNRDPYKNTALYPPIKPLNEYKMKVSNIHTIAYST
jgi:hypothetical protein